MRKIKFRPWNKSENGGTKMDDYIVLVCIDCGNIEVHGNDGDGLSCVKCKGHLSPTGRATREEYLKYIYLKNATVNCNYCDEAKETDVYGDETYKYMSSLQCSSNYGMWIYKTNGKWILRSKGDNKLNEVFISHCPKCGKELT